MLQRYRVRKLRQIHAGERPPGEETFSKIQAHREKENEEPTLDAVGSRGFGTLERLTLGSVSDKVVRTAASPVSVYRQPPTGTDARTSPQTDFTYDKEATTWMRCQEKT